MKNINDLIRFITLSDCSSQKEMELMAKRHHDKWTEKYSKWSFESTKHKLLSAYRTRIVPLHFFALLAFMVGIGVFFVFRNENPTAELAIISSAAVVTYIILYIWVYNTTYLNEYMPLLNHVIEGLNGSYLKELDAVKKNQYSAVAIVLIQVITSKVAGFPKLTGSKITKDQLAKLYGISERSFHDALNIILKANWKTGGRIDTEIADAFGEAKEYFNGIGSKEADKLLDSIKSDVLHNRQAPAY